MGRNILIFVGMTVLFGCNGIVSAEGEDTRTEVIDLEPIVVTASRMERELSEVSSNVSIITEKEIEDSNAKNVPGLLKDLEGVYMYDASGVGTTGRVNMRGFWGGMSTHQLVLIDGIPQNSGEDKLVDWDLIALDNIERIEVVRGPNSALYGDTAMSGVINIITKTPSATAETTISDSFGSYDTQNHRFSTSGFYKKFGYYLNLGTNLTDGFRRHCDYENIHLDGKLDFLTGQTQNLRLSLDYYERERGAYAWALTEAQVEEDRRQARPGSENDKSEAEKLNLGLTYRWDIGEIFQTENTFYYRHKDSGSFFTSGSTESSTKEQLKYEDNFGLLLGLNTNPEIFGLKHSFTAGVDLEKNDVDYEEFSAPWQTRGRIQKDYLVKREKIGPYLQGEIKPFEPLKLIGGVRYDKIEFKFTDYRNENNSKKTDMSEISPKFGMVYTYQENSKLYANYAQAFRTPTAGQMFTYGSYSNPDLNPEEAENYEAGMLHQFNDNLKVCLSLYWMELENEIWYDYSESKYKNVGETSHKGIETRLDTRIVKWLTGFINYSYIRAKNESGDYSGKFLTNIPKHKGSLGARLETDFGLHTNITVTRMGSAYIDSENEDKLSGYTTLDTKIGYEYKNWSAFLAIDNLLDKRYNSYGFKSGSTKNFNPAPERTFTFGMEVKF